MGKVKLKQVEEYEVPSAPPSTPSTSGGDVQFGQIVGIIPKEMKILTLFPDFPNGESYDTCSYVEDPFYGISEYVIAGKLPWDAIDFSYVSGKGVASFLLSGSHIGSILETAPKLLNTENIKSFDALFQDQGDLTSIQPFDSLENCESFHSMFWKCKKLSTIPDFPKIMDKAECTNMFYSCHALEAAPAIPGYIGEALSMFYDCKSLKTVPEYDMSKCSSMNCMFFKCESLAGEFPWEIDLSSITASSGISGMFQGTKITKVTFKNVPKSINDLGIEEIASEINYKNKIEVVIKNVLE